MKTNKIGTIFLISILALAGIGASYAGFFAKITVYGVVETATVELTVMDYSGTDVWKVYGPNAPNGEIVEWHGFISDPSRPTQGSLENAYPGCTVIPVASAWASKGTEYDINMTWNNIFPCVDFTADVILHYDGSIPALVDITDFEWDDTYYDFSSYTTFSYYWYTKDPTNDAWVKDEEITQLPVQMHECQYIGIEATIELEQDNTLQGLRGEFNFNIHAIQWNDECEQPSPQISNYGVAISSDLSYSSTGWGGWSVPADMVVLGGGFHLPGPAIASAPGTPNSVWPHYIFGANEYGWVVQNGGVSGTGHVYAIYGDEPPGYEIIEHTVTGFNPTGWGGWSAPAGKVVLCGGFEADHPVKVSAPATPMSSWPHYNYGANEYGWVIQNGGTPQDITIYLVCADMPAGYEVIKSSQLNYGDGGWGGWSAPAGKVVTGGGFELPGGPAAASAPATPSSSWPHYTYGANEYGWVVRDAPDGAGSTGSYVYVICID